MTKSSMRMFFPKAVIVIGLVSAVMLTGCRGVQRRAQRRFSYPPSATFAQPSASAPSRTATPPVETPPEATERAEPKSRSFFSLRRATPVPPEPVGFEEGAATVYRLREGDPVVVYLRGIHGISGGEQVIENIVSERGQIQLPYIGSVSVGGKTATEAQDIIRKTYIEKQIYRHLTVNVVIPARSYFIRGEVRQPGRYPLVGSITILQAVATAGGYSEFANRRNAEILRGERRIPVNMQAIERNTERDLPVEPGDVIVVHRSIF